MNTFRRIALLLGLAVAFSANAITLRLFADGVCVLTREYKNDAVIVPAVFPSAALEADSVEFLGWTDVPMQDVNSESKVAYYDYNRRLTADLDLYAVYAVVKSADKSFALVKSTEDFRAGDLYLFTDFSAADAADKHVMSVNQQGKFGFLASKESVNFEGDNLVPPSDAFVARLTDVGPTGRCRFAQHGTSKVFALNDGLTSATFQYVGCADPLPWLGESAAGSLSYFDINVSAECSVRMTMSERPENHIAYAALKRNGYTYNVFHNTSSSAALYVYRLKRTLSRITRFASQPPLPDGLSDVKSYSVVRTDGGLLVKANSGSRVRVFDAFCRTIADGVVDKDEMHIRLNVGHGVYFVLVNGELNKIIL